MITNTGSCAKLVNTNMLFTGRKVCIGKNCARGLLKTEGTVLPYTDRPKQVNNRFIFFPTFASLQNNLERSSERAEVSLSQVAGNRGANVIINLQAFNLSLFSTRNYPINTEKVVFQEQTCAWKMVAGIRIYNPIKNSYLSLLNTKPKYSNAPLKS